MTPPAAAAEPFWSLPLPDLFQQLEAGPEGLHTGEAMRRLQRHGPNRLRHGTRSGTALVLQRWRRGRATPIANAPPREGGDP